MDAWKRGQWVNGVERLLSEGAAHGAQPQTSPDTVHFFAQKPAPSGAPGHMFELYKRADLHRTEQVAVLLVQGEGMRSERIVERVCRVLDDELASR